ncbi:MAG: cyd operon YbgE family protein [Thauera sp.]|nr:cyd operon YbgE family protein [Thauera sp.]
MSAPDRTPPCAAGSTPAHAPAPPRIRLLPLLAAIAVMLGITAWPGALAGPDGAADHWSAMALFWAMSAGFVSGVGFRPHNRIARYLFSPLACLAGIGLALWRVAGFAL